MFCGAEKKVIRLLFSEVLICGNCVKTLGIINHSDGLFTFFFSHDDFRVAQKAQNALNLKLTVRSKTSEACIGSSMI